MANEIDNTLEDRGKSYGDFSKMSDTAQKIKRIFRQGDCWTGGMPTYAKEALDLIATKIARIVDGDPYHEDSWHDIVGYATLARDRVREEMEPEEIVHPPILKPGKIIHIADDVQMPIIKKFCTCGAVSGQSHWASCPIDGVRR